MTSLRRRLLLSAGLAVSLVFALSGVLVAVLARSGLVEQFDDALVARARALSALVEQDEDRVSVEIELDPAGTPGDVAFFELWDGERVLLRSTSLGGTDLARSPGPLAIDDVTTPAGPGRQVTLRFPARREPDEAHAAGPGRTVTLVLARPTAEVRSSIDRIVLVLVGVGALGTVLCLVLLAGVVRFGLAPLRDLAAAIGELRDGDLALKLDRAKTPRELAAVVERLDDAMTRLGAAIARERELTAEVAHELRTPLAGIRATIEVALSRDDRPAQKYRAALADSLAIAQQTERLVETMLSLARLDAGAVKLATSDVHADELLREILAGHAATLAARQVRVSTELEAVTLSTDRDKLSVVLANLIDNAVSYVDDSGEIRISLTEDRIRIENTGCTLPAGEAPQVFERFWRGDSSRGGTGTHAGLGLALCHKLVDALGGTITARVETGRFISEVTL